MDYEPALNEPSPKSTHRCEVVEVHPKVHPNADKLEVVDVFGYSVCVGKGQFKDGDLGVYIPPDSIVPVMDAFKFVWEMKGYAPPPHLDTSAFAGSKEAYLAFLDSRVPTKYRRVKAKVLRGVISEGLLMPITDFLSVLPDCGNGGAYELLGQDVAPYIGVTHYDPPEITSMAGDCEAAPVKKAPRPRRPKTLRGWCRFLWHKMFPKPVIVGHEENTGIQIPNYDVDSWQRHHHLLEEGETVWIAEKIHGANCKFTFMNDRMYVGSHYQWKKDIPGSAFWDAMRQNPWIEKFCRENPGYVIYGELVPTQKLNYGQKKGEYRVFGFDIYGFNLTTGARKWLDYGTIETLGLLQPLYWVPIIARVAYSKEDVREYTRGNTLVPKASHIREGIVIRPERERSDPRFGRVILKIVSTEYLASKHSDE